MSEYDIENLGLKDIQPMNMQKRVRVFTEQLLPNIVIQATSKDGIEFGYNEVSRLGFKFIRRLERDDMADEIIEVQASMRIAIAELFRKFKELLNREQNRESRPGP